MRRTAVNIAIGLALGIGFVAFNRLESTRERAAHDAEPQREFPAGGLPLIAGGPGQATIAGLRGASPKRVLVNFWASWCEACKSERGLLKSATAASRGAFLGVATSDKENDARAAEAMAPHGYPIALDADGTAANAFGVRVLPTTVILDSDGRELLRFERALKEADLEVIATELGTVPDVARRETKGPTL